MTGCIIQGLDWMEEKIRPLGLSIQLYDMKPHTQCGWFLMSIFNVIRTSQTPSDSFGIPPLISELRQREMGSAFKVKHKHERKTEIGLS